MFKIYVINGKALSKGTHLPNMKALSLRIKKLWLKIKYFRRSKVKVKVTCSKFMVPPERSCHKEHCYTHAKYESPTGCRPNLPKYQISPMHTFRWYIVIFLHVIFFKERRFVILKFQTGNKPEISRSTVETLALARLGTWRDKVGDQYLLG